MVWFGQQFVERVKKILAYYISFIITSKLELSQHRLYWSTSNKITICMLVTNFNKTNEFVSVCFTILPQWKLLWRLLLSFVIQKLTFIVKLMKLHTKLKGIVWMAHTSCTCTIFLFLCGLFWLTLLQIKLSVCRKIVLGVD